MTFQLLNVSFHVTDMLTNTTNTKKMATWLCLDGPAYTVTVLKKVFSILLNFLRHKWTWLS